MKKSLLTVCAALTLGLAIARGDVIISEFVAGNGKGLRDENAEIYDCIEIQNRRTDPVDLIGWSLTRLVWSWFCGCWMITGWPNT